MEKFYLGDGVYLRHELGRFVLTTEDGVRVTNEIVLEPQVFAQLVERVTTISKREIAGLVEQIVADEED